MNFQVLGIYREPEFSPGKVASDRAIMDAVLAYLRDAGARTVSMQAAEFVSGGEGRAELVLAMCQGPEGLKRLALLEKAGAIVINSALAIRNCYRDLLGAGLAKAGAPAPLGVVVATSPPLDLQKLRVLDLSAPVYVKRGDLHALGPDDVQRVSGLDSLKSVLLEFNGRGIEAAFVQQEVRGPIVKFYGIGTAIDYFSTVAPEGLHLKEALQRDLARASAATASALGLEVWGGDAIIDGEGFSIVDFNDWPSFERVRDGAAAAIGRRCVNRLRTNPTTRAAFV
jgi:hypothetical protein